MDIAFGKLIEKIGYVPVGIMKEVRIRSVELFNSDTFEINFLSKEFIPVVELEEFLVKLNKNFTFKSKINFDIELPIYTQELIYQYVIFCFKYFMGQSHINNKYVKEQFVVNKNEIIINFKTKFGVEYFQSTLKTLQTKLNKFGFKNLNFKLVLQEMNVLADEKEKNQLQINSLADEFDQRVNNELQETKFDKNRRKIVVASISAAKESYNSNVIVEGEIFKINVFTTKTAFHIITIGITDYKDAIYVKLFANDLAKKDLYLQNYLIGSWISVNGEIKIDNYLKDHTISAKKIIVLNDKMLIRRDDAITKRVELSTRTNMSTMDGILKVESTLKRAQKWGHKAIAFLDHENVQSFPDIYNLSKKYQVKPIYGATFSVIDRKNEMVLNIDPQNEVIKNNSYIIFDLETTGLSPIRDEIIEFGATKMINGMIVETKQFFLQSSKPLSDFTKNLTKITDEMVQAGMSESSGIAEIRKYLDGFVVIAHNAPFDMGFVYEKIAKFNLKPLNVTVIDSLVVARFLEPKAKRFRLESVSNRYGFKYDSTVAHRGDYDADILARVWNVMVERINSLGIKIFTELENSFSQNVLERKRPREVSIIAKNQQGLKELFKLISKSTTEQYFKGPRLFKEELLKSPNLLIGSSALKSKLVESILTGTSQMIKDEIGFYDYIEVQPPSNFAHLINRSQISKEQLHAALKNVIEIAQKKNILVVATGDVRYLDEKDSIYHEVYINAKGLGGVRHYLFKYNEPMPVYPKQFFLTTNQMKEKFAFLENINLINEIVVENSNKIADLIEEIEIIKPDLYTPTIKDADKMLTELVYLNARNQYGNPLPKIVAARIKKELESIIKYGYGVIYWIAHKLVAKSLADGYLVGSRGSVGSSLVATLANITEVNPLKAHYYCPKCQFSKFPETTKKVGYDLKDEICPKCKIKLNTDGHTIPFETFLGFAGDKVPDIDLNFSGEYQPIIHQEVKNIFGETHSFRAGTISTVAERTAFGYVKAWAEETDRNYSNLFIEFLAKNVQGTKRTTGQHPGGIIVIPKTFSVEDFTPINYPANDVNANWKTTHFDFHAIHDNVLKLDLLGHDDPTAIKMLERLTGINALTIPDYDSEVIQLFSSPTPLKIKPADISGETTGVMGIPEFGTKFVRGMLKSVKVKSFQDLVSVSGLSHGTDVWNNNGEVLIKSMGLELSDIISCRDDIMIDLINEGIEKPVAFQIMERVRKGKSLTESQEALMRQSGVKEWYINSCKKIKYMFPKAHATAYVKMAWRIAWYKINYPLEFYATFFTTRADVYDIDIMTSNIDVIRKKISSLSARRYKSGEDKLKPKEVALIPILEIVEELKARKFNINNINLKKSLSHEWIIDFKAQVIIPPFSAIDGLGSTVADSIVKARDEKEFISIQDFKIRTATNSTSLKKMIELNIMDGLEETNQISFALFS